MNTYTDTFSITDLRHKTIDVLKRASEKGVVYLIRHSKKEAAIVDMDYLAGLQAAYEEYMDIKEYDETIGMKRTPLSAYKKRS